MYSSFCVFVCNIYTKANSSYVSPYLVIQLILIMGTFSNKTLIISTVMLLIAPSKAET